MHLRIKRLISGEHRQPGQSGLCSRWCKAMPPQRAGPVSKSCTKCGVNYCNAVVIQRIQRAQTPAMITTARALRLYTPIKPIEFSVLFSWHATGVAPGCKTGVPSGLLRPWDLDSHRFTQNRSSSQAGSGIALWKGIPIVTLISKLSGSFSQSSIQCFETIGMAESIPGVWGVKLP